MCRSVVCSTQSNLLEKSYHIRSAGDKSQVCGGYNIVSVWEDPTFPVLSAPPNAAEDYQSLGCYSDSNSTGRALAWRQDQVDASNLTQLHCASACELGGYAYAGVEYGSECYCGMGLLDGSTQIDDSKCNIVSTVFLVIRSAEQH